VVLRSDDSGSSALDEPDLVFETTCPHCGRVGNSEATFCGGCGGRVHGRLSPVQETAREPGLWMALGLYAAALAIIVGLMIADGVGTDAMGLADWMFLALAGVALILNPRTTLPLFRAPRLTVSGIAKVLAAMGLTLGFVELLVLLVPEVFFSPTALYRLEGISLGATLVSMAVMPAVAEEIIFRGPILGGLQRSFGNRSAIWVSAAMFAILHLSVLSAVHLLAIGVLTATVRLRTRSLLPPIAIHFGYNAVVVLLGWTRPATDLW
jgi:membrane protease YdiL (CAAX protease family)